MKSHTLSVSPSIRLFSILAGTGRGFGADFAPTEIQAGGAGHDQAGRQHCAVQRGIPTRDDHQAAEPRIRS